MEEENWRFVTLFFSEESWLAWFVDASVSNIFASGKGGAITADKRSTIIHIEDSFWFCDISRDKTLRGIDSRDIVAVIEHFGHIGDISSVPTSKIDGNYPSIINKIGHVGDIRNIKVAEVQ